MRTDLNPKQKRTVLLGAGIFAAIIIIVLLSSFFGDGKAQLGKVIPKDLVSYNDNVMLVSAEGVSLSDSRGRIEWSLDVPNSDTITSTRGKFILLADISANKLHLAYEGKMLGEYAAENRIISASVNRRGNIAVACDETGYKGMIVLLDKKGREKYRWHCGDGYLTDIDLSSDGRYIAAAMITTDNRTAGSKLIVIDTKSGEIKSQTTRENSAIGTVRFTDSGKIITVADNELVGYEKDGRIRYEISFGGRMVSDFNIENENNMVIAIVNNKNNTTLEIYSDSGKLRGSYEAKGELKNITVNGSVTAANLMRDIYYINSNGKLKNIKTCEHEIKDMCLFGDGRHVFAAGGSGKYSIIKIR